MTVKFDRPNVVKFSDKILLLYYQLQHIAMRILMRAIIGKKRRNEWYRKHNRVWMSPITGKKLLIENEQGFRFWVRANTEDATIVGTKFEHDVLTVFNPSQGDIVLDVGAHIGKYTIHTANLVGTKGRIIALEPFNETFDLLCKNIQENGFEEIVQPVRIAASNKKGQAKMHFLENWWGLNSIVSTPGENYVEVNTDTIDSLLKDMKIGQVNWMKIDVEGAEYNVLSGAIETLRKNKVNLIIEVRSVNKDKVLNLLESLEYSVSILESYNLESTTNEVFYNMFAKKSITS